MTVGAIVTVGVLCVDIINFAPHYPAENDKLHITRQHVCKGGELLCWVFAYNGAGNASNSACVLSQLGHDCCLLAVLGSKRSAQVVRFVLLIVIICYRVQAALDEMHSFGTDTSLCVSYGPPTCCSSTISQRLFRRERNDAHIVHHVFGGHEVAHDPPLPHGPRDALRRHHAPAIVAALAPVRVGAPRGQEHRRHQAHGRLDKGRRVCVCVFLCAWLAVLCLGFLAEIVSSRCNLVNMQ